MSKENVFTIAGITYHIRDIKAIGKLSILQNRDIVKHKFFDYFKDIEKVDCMFTTTFKVYFNNGERPALAVSKAVYQKGNKLYFEDDNLFEVREEIVEKWSNYNSKPKTNG